MNFGNPFFPFWDHLETRERSGVREKGGMTEWEKSPGQVGIRWSLVWIRLFVTLSTNYGPTMLRVR